MPGTTKPTGEAGNNKKYSEEEVQTMLAAAKQEGADGVIAQQEKDRLEAEQEAETKRLKAIDRKEKIENSEAYKGREEQAKAYLSGDMQEMPTSLAIKALENAPLDPVKRSNLGNQLDSQNSDIAHNSNNENEFDDAAEEMVQFHMAHGKDEKEARSMVKEFMDREARSPSQTAVVPFQ